MYIQQNSRANYTIMVLKWSVNSCSCARTFHSADRNKQRIVIVGRKFWLFRRRNVRLLSNNECSVRVTYRG